MFNPMRNRIPCGVWALAAGLLASAAVAADKPYTEEGRKQGWLWFRPAKADPAAQLEHARRLRDQRRPRRANWQYRALAESWPAAPEAPQAVLERAQLLDRRGARLDAFEIYQELAKRYAGAYPYEAVLQRQYEIALELMTTRRARWFFGGFEAPERAIPLLEHLVEFAPRWKEAPAAQFLIGKAHEIGGDYEAAVVAYTETLFRYPESPVAREAAYRRAFVLYKMTEGAPNDERLAEESWAALTLFLRSYPDDENAALCRVYADRVRSRRARIAYGKARYYDRIARRPAAARLAYQRYLEQFPDELDAVEARRRMDALGAAADAPGTNETDQAELPEKNNENNPRDD